MWKSLKQAGLIPYLIYSILSEFDVQNSFFLVFLAAKGVSTLNISVLYASSLLTSIVTEVPLGFLADRIGCRIVLVFSAVLSLIYAGLMFSCSSLYFLFLAFFLQGTARSAASGASETYLYNLLARKGAEEVYANIESKVTGFSFIFLGLAAFTGGVLSTYSWKTLYAAYIVVLILVIFSCLKMEADADLEMKPIREWFPRGYGFDRIIYVIPNYSADFKNAIREILKDRCIVRALFAYTSVESAVFTVFYFGQILFQEKGFDKSTIGIALGLAEMGGAIGYFLSGWIWKNIYFWISMTIAAIAIPLLFFGAILTGNLYSVACFIGGVLFGNAAQLLSVFFLQENGEATRRATTLSLGNWLVALMSAAFIFLVGVISKQSNLPTALMVVAVMPLFTIFVSVGKKERRHEKTAS